MSGQLLLNGTWKLSWAEGDGLWTENFKTYEIYLGDPTTPAAKGILQQGHGP